MNAINNSKFNSLYLSILMLTASSTFHAPLAIAQTEKTKEAASIVEPEEIPKTSVQIANATAVPSISLKVNNILAYRDLPQGIFTADAPTSILKPEYLATDLRTGAEAVFETEFEADTNQTLIIMGDFSKLPEEATSTNHSDDEAKATFNVEFRVLSHELDSNEARLRYRFLNAIQDKNIIIKAPYQTSPSLGYGAIWTVSQQPKTFEYDVVIEDKELRVLINQAGNLRNCTIVFYLKNGEPTFMRLYENTQKFHRVRIKEEARQEKQ